MGTRHLIAVHLDGKYPVAQYGQWDGYPEGQGVTVLSFLKDADLNAFKEKCRAARFMSESELESLSGDWSKTHPQISRDAGADVLGMILNAPDGIKLKNTLSFAGDSLFCEWAYVIDFDARILEVFKGFNQEPLEATERFANIEELEASNNEKYYPVRSVAKWPLDALPDKDAFLSATCEKEEA